MQVCGIGNKEAEVACRQMGLPLPAIAVHRRLGPGKASQPIWMSNVECTGSERRLDQCKHSGWAIHSCTHASDVGVACNYSGLASLKRVGAA